MSESRWVFPVSIRLRLWFGIDLHTISNKLFNLFLGPIGGNGGEFMDYIDIHYEPYMNRRSDSAHKYIDGIRGKTVISQEGSCICELEFKYVIVPWDSRFGWQADTIPDSDTNSESSSES